MHDDNNLLLRMLNPLVNLCERGFDASQIVSAIKVLSLSFSLIMVDEKIIKF